MDQRDQQTGPGPSRWLDEAEPYEVPSPGIPVDLTLSGNEGASPPGVVMEALRQMNPGQLCSYPDNEPVRKELAKRFDVGSEQIMVTAGADEALNAFCRAYLDPDRNVVLPDPTFVMLSHYASLTGAEIRQVPWKSGPYPVDDVVRKTDSDTAAVAVVSPNNPTGAVASEEHLRRLSGELPETLILLDHAYVEFAESRFDLTRIALSLPNVVVTRTLSKALGLAGIRVGYVLASRDVIHWMQTVTNPYSVSSLSLRVARKRLSMSEDDVSAFIDRVRPERSSLSSLLRQYDLTVYPSEANFVFLELDRRNWVHRAFAGMGIAVRKFEQIPSLDRALRITCPGNEEEFSRLTHAVETIFDPEALLFDMDGVLADVSESYRKTIRKTAASFDVRITPEEIRERKLAGDATNDWKLTHELLSAHGVEVSFEDVRRKFEELYQGTEERPGFREDETLLIEKDVLNNWAESYSLGIVTGRPTSDAVHFLERHEIRSLFDAVVCMEDGPDKPDPAPVQKCLDGLGAKRGWMFGDTPDDVRAARSAGVLPVGFRPASEKGRGRTVLTEAGAADVFTSPEQISELLP